MYGARKAGRALLEGKCVASNVRFTPGWERLVLRRAPHYKLAGRRRKKEYEREIATRYLYEPELAKLLSVRVKGHGEKRCVRILDEAHNEINNREWEKENQKVALRKLTLARKRGFEDYVITQHIDNTDAAVRRIASCEIKVINWQQLTRVPLIGTNLLPLPIFLAMGFRLNQNRQAVSVGKPVFRELYSLGWYRNLYDTFEDFDLPDDDPELVQWLPLSAPPLTVLPTAEGTQEGAPSGVADGEPAVNPLSTQND